MTRRTSTTGGNFGAYFVIGAFLLVGRTAAESVEEDDGDQYFGVPLGALHFSSDGTSAEIYAADEFTIIFNHFYHNPRKAGCTAMMVGPARKEDRENVVEGHGLLLAPAHPPVAARYRHRVRRDALRAPLAAQFSGWPMEFGHLLMAPAPAADATLTAAAAAGEMAADAAKSAADEGQKSGVNGSGAATEEDGKIHIHKFTLSEPPRLESESRALKPIIVTPPSTSTTVVENFSSTATVASSANASDSSDITFTDATTSASSSTTVTPISPADTVPMTESTLTSTVGQDQIEEPNADPPLPIIFFGSKGVGKAKPVKSTSASDVTVTSSGETFAFESASNAVRNDDVSGAAFSEDEFVRRAPARTEFIDPSKPGFLNRHTAQLKTTTPLFYVIKDPREARRQRLLALRRKVEGPFTTTTQATTTLEPTIDFDGRFELPAIRDKLATFSLTNGAKINQYKWIGLYDQCLKRHIPLVSLRDIDPPREEKIMPLSGWFHNVTSYRVHILNCNTVLIPGFTYDPTNATANTYFFVGIGEFPNNIERQMKATVVGSRRDDPLHPYNGEDVLLRLPRGFRTFDVDFISVFNTDEQKSYAHVNIPSLLVPPCAED